jgi:hypothetical protein
MQSGRRPSSAAGRPSPGTTPPPAPKTPRPSSRFGTLNPINAPCNLKKLNFAPAKFTLRNAGGMTKGLSYDPTIPTPAPNRHTQISNRHLVRLEIAASPAKSTTSFFLIVTKRPYFPNALSVSPRSSLRSAFAFPHISNVYSMQLENAATPAPSTKLPSLLGTSSHIRASAFQRRRRARERRRAKAGRGPREGERKALAAKRGTRHSLRGRSFARASRLFHGGARVRKRRMRRHLNDG